ncbi:MAG: sugar ABC transporter permease, partial [Pseudohongiellaceae bacterium]
FYGVSDVHIAVSTGMTFGFLVLFIGLVWWIFKTGYKLKS